MLNELMWVLIAHLLFLFTFIVPAFALMWVAGVFVKALKKPARADAQRVQS